MSNWQSKYRYKNEDGKIIIEAKDMLTQVELNRISRYLFGEGASLNQVFNCGVGAFIKFQSTMEVNKKRSQLLTKVWRWCKTNDIKISSHNFPSKGKEKMESLDFSLIKSRLSSCK